jgi:hypothetical protein
LNKFFMEHAFKLADTKTIDGDQAMVKALLIHLIFV